MNYTFEQDFTSKLLSHMTPIIASELNREKGSLIEETLDVLRDKTIAIDADILLRKVSACPLKSFQEGHSSLDMTVQVGIASIIKTLRYVT